MATPVIVGGTVRSVSRGGGMLPSRTFIFTHVPRANQSRVGGRSSGPLSARKLRPSQQRRWYSTPSGNQNHLKPPKPWSYSRAKGTGLGIAAAATGLVLGCATYFFGPYDPTPMPEAVMKKVGYDPELDEEECPILVPPSVPELEELVNTLGRREGETFAGVVDVSQYRGGDSHFYTVVANCGNVHKMAAATGLPVERIIGVLTSPEGMLMTWAGCMMAGGGAIYLTPEGARFLHELMAPQIERPILRQDRVIGQGVLTSGYDNVQLSHANRVQGEGVLLNSFLARTMYFHSLSGSVLHMQYLTAKGDIVWIWVGAGGRGFNSRYVNNPAAIHLDLGMWPDMARSIRGFYSDPELVKAVVNTEPMDMGRVIQQLVVASQSRKGTFKDVMQRIQVGGGYLTRLQSSIQAGSMYGVKGEGKKTL